MANKELEPLSSPQSKLMLREKMSQKYVDVVRALKKSPWWFQQSCSPFEEQPIFVHQRAVFVSLRT